MTEIERSLQELAPARQNLPRHIAIIMDGNGRWAKLRGMPRVFGHQRGVDAVRGVVRAASVWGIEALTLFAFSEENWGRPRAEVSAIFKILNQYIMKEREELKRQNVRLRVMGDLTRLPEQTATLIRDAVSYLSECSGMTLNVGISYGSRSEIINSCRSIAQGVREGTIEPDEIDETLFESRLDTAGLPDPDLVIRTSGEQRVSNFMLWQISYAEFLFSPVFWPDFNEEIFAEAITEFQRRARRFGKIPDETELASVRSNRDSAPVDTKLHQAQTSSSAPSDLHA